MKNLYQLQTLLVALFLTMLPAWSFGQFAEPITAYVKNTGSAFTDQFPGADGYAYSYTESNPNLGTVNFQPAGAPNTYLFSFIPAQGITGVAEVTVEYFTLAAPMHPVTRTYRIHIVNEVVTAGEDRYVIEAGSTDVVLDVLQNDSVTNGTLTITTVSISNEGLATVNTTSDAIIYTPDADFTGDTWLQYVVCDEDGNCGQSNVHILVRDSNNEDNLVFQKHLLHTDRLDLLTPFEGYTVDINPQHGTLEHDGLFGWTYTPDPGYVGNDTFQLGLTGLITRLYQVAIYDKPGNVHARNDKFYVRPNLSVTFNVLNNDLLDYNVSEYTAPNKGVLSEVGNGVYTYTPVPGFRGVDKFTYTTCYEDTVYCETATVLIHVTDLEPDNVFTYSLQTSIDLPLAIDYPIEYTDFSYIISDEPVNGQLINYAGLNQIDLPCDTIDSYNMLVYQPNPGYTGPDHFEYYYCIQPSNLCYLVKVDVAVVNHPETESCPCTIDCIWPGDSDRDGRVDMSDLLVLGNRLGDIGPVRPYTNPSNWFGQHGLPWSTGENINTRFLDGNGDGVLSKLDVQNISDNYYRTHDVVVRDVNQKLPYQFSIIPVQFSLDSGDVVVLDIALGNAIYPVIDLKGAKFSINLPQNMIDSASLEVDFHQDSWLTEGAPFISLAKTPWDGRIDGGIARARGKGATGYGVIATVTFIIVDDIEGFKDDDGTIEIPVILQAGAGMDNNGTLYDLEGDEFILKYKPYDTNRPEFNLIVYPNPAHDLVDIHLNGKTTIGSIDIIDPQGRQIANYAGIDAKHHQLNVLNLPAGLYYVKVNHTHGVISQLLSIIK